MKGKLTMKSMLSTAFRIFTPGPLRQLVVNLRGKDGEQWETNLKRFLRKEESIWQPPKPREKKTVCPRKFKTWKTIKLGTGLKTGEDFRLAIENSGCDVSGYVTEEMLNRLDLGVSSVPIEVELVNISVEEMGFYVKREGWNDITSASLKDIYERAQQFGLGLCPGEVGPQLRLQYLDQPKNDDDDVYIGMKPIPIPSSVRHEGNCIFLLCSSKGKLVIARRSLQDYQHFFLRHRLIFLQKKK